MQPWNDWSNNMTKHEDKREPTNAAARKLPPGFSYPKGWIDRSGEHGYPVAVFLDSMEALADGEIHKSNRGQEIVKMQDQPDEPDNWHGGLTRLDSWKAKGIEGWPEGVQRMHEALKAVKANKALDVRRRRTRGPEGDDLDIHSIYGGRLETAWERMAPRQGYGSPVVRIWIEASTPGMMTADQMFWRGAAAMAVTERLEESGYRVEIQIYSHLDKLWDSPGNEDYFRAVCAKRADRTLDLEALTFLSAHPASHRVAGFLAYCRHPWKCQNGLGHPDRRIPTFVADGDLCVRNIWSAREAQEWVTETMRPYL